MQEVKTGREGIRVVQSDPVKPEKEDISKKALFRIGLDNEDQAALKFYFALLFFIVGIIVTIAFALRIAIFILEFGR